MSAPQVRCPQCGSEKTWRDGFRKYRGVLRQRWLCRSCGFRFSESTAQLQVKVNVSSQFFKNPDPRRNDSDSMIFGNNLPDQKAADDFSLLSGEDVSSHSKPYASIVEKQINTLCLYNRERRVCAGEAKNLAEKGKEEKESQKSETAGVHADLKGLLVTFAVKSQLRGLNEETIRRRVDLLKLLQARGANLLNPESMFQAIDHAKKWNWKEKQLSTDEWSEGTKHNASVAYQGFCELLKIPILEGINFDKWGRRAQKLPWIPLETEIDQLTAGCTRSLATFLQLLKETGMRSGEAIRLLWADMDLEHGVITVNHPEKHSLPRQFKISGKLVAMLNYLPKKTDRVFPIDLKSMRRRLFWQRNRIAQKLQNPRIKRITFHTLRHWYGTMEYHKTKNILHVQDRLGHKSITSTLVYTHLVNFETDEYYTATSQSVQEDEELLKVGFEYVTEREGVKIYRKRK